MPMQQRRSPRTASRRAPHCILVTIFAGLLLAVSACAPSGDPTSQPVTLDVFAAASLQAAFTTIGQHFHHAHPNVGVSFNFGGSNTLAQQITQGAPADVFASANAAQMDVVVKAGDASGADVKTFAHNRLVVVYPKSNPAQLYSLHDLARPGVKIVLAAAAVPAGQYALVFLDKASADPSFGASYKANVLKNVVSYEQDVKSVLTKVSLGEADAGIVYVTDAATATSSLSTLDIPDALNTVAVYPIVAVNGSPHAALAQQFVAAVDSADGQAVLASYGFIAGAAGVQYSPPGGS
ncbi:MAG TPA: molybdate ABC transporter substrate-binding protein [Ktedonobacterales bacterium]